jgi:hypothetical protein
MKHISAYFDKVERAVERFAWLPVRSSFSKQLIWFSRYIELQIYFDDQGRPPIRSRSWNLIYTSSEYTRYCLGKELKI